MKLIRNLTMVVNWREGRDGLLQPKDSNRERLEGPQH